jgi:uncharacterized repeat protein (TIGR03809 family)
MPARYVGPRFELVVPRWRDLAEKRLDYYTELYRSGRWQIYFTEADFRLRMQDVVRAVKQWRELAEQAPLPAVSGEIRPAA